MNTNVQNLSGWILILVGLIIIAWTLYSSFNIFMAKAIAPQIFKIEKSEKESMGPDRAKAPDNFIEVQEQAGKIIGEQLKELIPLGSSATILNLISWSIFAGILIFTGGQISSLGIKLIKK